MGGFHKEGSTRRVKHKGSSTRGVSQGRVHKGGSTRRVPQGGFHKEGSTGGFPQGWSKAGSTRGVPQGVFHKGSSTRGVPQEGFHLLSSILRSNGQGPDHFPAFSAWSAWTVLLGRLMAFPRLSCILHSVGWGLGWFSASRSNIYEILEHL